PAVVGDDDRVGAGLSGELRIYGIEYALEDELAAPAVFEALHVVPIERRVELLGGPGRERAHVRHALDVTDDVAEGSALGAQHAQPPARPHGDVENVGQGHPWRCGQPVLYVLVALAQDLQVEREHERRAAGGLGPVDQAINELAVPHYVELKPE